MIRSFLNFVTSLLLAILFSFVLPWWGIMLAAFAAALVVPLRGFSSFMAPFLAVAFFWMAYSWWLGSQNDFVLAQKIAVIFPLQGSSALLILLTGLVGGVAAGFSGVFGSTLLSLFRKRGRSFNRLA